ncbi:hypothetical protein K3495_g3913 [Podosphaera aphanis]|nr:hypothetical protein K3495_g3913 [Podosphaera aphanis]
MSPYLHSLASGLLFFLGLCVGASGAVTAYCSEINTSSSGQNLSVYQSNGLCTNFCLQQYAFAILQDKSCWCSNYIPATTTTGCTLNCPGYPFEKCGGDGLYGYIALGKVAPSGTLGASSEEPTSPSTSTSTSSSIPLIIPPSQVTVTETPIVITSTETVPRSLSFSSTSSSDFSMISTSTSVTTTSATSLTWTPTPLTSVRTISGSGFTVTVTPTVAPTSPVIAPASQNNSRKGLSTRAAVVLTAGLVILVAIICSIVYFCIRKRRDQRSADIISIGDRKGSTVGLGGQIPSRTMSENSRYVLGTDGHRVVETWETKDEVIPKKGKLIPVDPRLDPFAPVYRNGDNKSRDSVNTLRDDLDYSRRVHGFHRGPILRATNPDEED